MIAPMRLALEPHAPQLGAREQLANLLSEMVDRVRRDQRVGSWAQMAASPCDQLGHVVARDLGDQLVLAEELDQQIEAVLSADRARMMLAHLLPVAARDIIKPQRCARRLGLRNDL